MFLSSNQTPLYRLGHWIYRYRWVVVFFWVLVLIASATGAPKVGSILKAGFGEQNTEARLGLDLLEDENLLSPSILIIVFSSDDLKVQSAEYKFQVNVALSGISDYPGLNSIRTVYNANDASLVSDDGKITYAIALFDFELDQSLDEVPMIREQISATTLDIWVTGASAIFSDINEYSGRDLKKAEIITFPLVTIALLLIFGTVISVLAPLAMGAFSLSLTLAIIYLLGLFTDMSVFSLNTATLLGVGASIDYSLLMVSRFREELGSKSVQESIAITVATAGKAIFFSAVTTVIGLSGLLIFQLSMLRSIGIGGIVVITISLLAALTLLPALLGIIGHHVNALSIMPGFLQRRGRFWHTVSSWVMSHPFLVIIPVIAFLLVLGAPFLQAKLGIPWASVLPKEAESRQGWDLASDKFGEGTLAPIVVAAHFEKSVLNPENITALYKYSREASVIKGVTRVESIVDLGPDISLDGYRTLYSDPLALTARGLAEPLGEYGSGRTTMMRVYTSFDINSDQARHVVDSLRSIVPTNNSLFYVSGATASLMDAVDVMYGIFPWALVLVTGSVYIVLAILFRSVVIPIKALIMNGMSIFASYGALVFIFQQGHFEGLLNFSATGFVDATVPILLFMIIFGISMDYEVFLLVRIKEIYDSTQDNRYSVRLGLEKTGRIITSAAIVLVLVAGSFTFGDIVIIKALGLGIALAIFLDSTIVRALLVPALMRVLGDFNWWAPYPLKKPLQKEAVSPKADSGNRF